MKSILLLAAALMAGQSAFAELSAVCKNMKVPGISHVVLAESAGDFGKGGPTGPKKSWQLEVDGKDVLNAHVKPIANPQNKNDIKGFVVTLPDGGVLQLDLKSESLGFIFRPTADGKFDPATNTGCGISID